MKGEKGAEKRRTWKGRRKRRERLGREKGKD